MFAIYRMNAEELDSRFLETLKATFKNKQIEIAVTEADETDYLFRAPANREHLLRAVEDVEKKQQIVVPDQGRFQ